MNLIDNAIKYSNNTAEVKIGFMEFDDLQRNKVRFPFKKEEIALVVVSPNDPRAMVKFTAECQERSLPFIFDPSQQIPRLSGRDLREGARGSRMVILNDYEGDLFKKKTGLTDEDVLGLSETMVVTMGEKGSIVRTQEGSVVIPVAPPERIVDPTGVGDAYRAGLIKGMMHGLPWEVAGRMGSLTATYVLETDGPQNHSYTLKAFVERYCRTFGESKEVRRLVSGR